MKSRQLRLLAVSAAFAACSATTPSAFAANKWFSDYWTTGRVLREWLDWRAATGWALVGAGNVLLTATWANASNAKITQTAVGALCGTSAAGVMATWKPVAEATAASHIKAIMKGGSVVAASTACQWMTALGFQVINHGIPIAQRGIDGMSLKNGSELQGTMMDVHTDYVVEASSLVDYKNAVAELKAAFDNVRASKCGGSDNTPVCKKAWDKYDAAMLKETNALAQLNSYGRDLKVNMNRVNETIGG